MKATLAGALAGIIAGSLVAAALLVVTAFPLFAQTTQDAHTGAPTHEQMHVMMDAMHGEGTSARIHEMMGEEGEQMMEQCVQMMAMMQNMMGMMGSGGMDMMGGQDSQSRQDMMRGMMGR